MGLFSIFKKKKKEPKTPKVITVSYDEIEKEQLKKDTGFNTLLINGAEFVLKKDAMLSAMGMFLASAYGTVDGIQVKISLPKNNFSDNLIDVKPEYVERISAVTQDFEKRYNLVVDRIAAASADYLNALKVRDELYTKEEVKQNIDTKNITIGFPKDCVFYAYLDDENVWYSEYEDGSYKVDIDNQDENEE